MAALIVGLILIAIAIAAFIYAKRAKFTIQKRVEVGRYETKLEDVPHTVPNKIIALAAIIPALIGLLLIGFQSFYTQGVGEASVIRSFTGQVVGFNDRAGLAFKSPTDDTIQYNILNQQAIFSLPANVHDDQKNDVAGGEISITDKDGVSANVDVALRYSIRADQVSSVFSKFGDQKAFTSKLITQDMRAVVREVPNGFSTIDMLTKRADVEAQILKSLQDRWEKEGVQVDSVALQDIRYPDAVKQKYADAQNARTQATQAQAELDAAKISAQQQVVQAQAQADANKILSASLTPEILKQRELDTLKEIGDKGNLVVTDGSSTPLLNVPAKK